MNKILLGLTAVFALSIVSPTFAHAESTPSSEQKKEEETKKEEPSHAERWKTLKKIIDKKKS